MNIRIEYKNKVYNINSKAGIDISIPTNFNKKIGPKFYDKEVPKVDYYNSFNRQYSLDAKGPCNVPIIKFNVHCSGTHTECANHILINTPTVNKLQDIHFIPSQLITVKPTTLKKEEYHCNLTKQDKVISKIQLSNAIGKINSSFIRGLIIRTLPNDNSKSNRDYNLNPHPFLSNDAVIFLKDIGVEHILIDTPSIDRYNDNGKLGNHHIFFKDKNRTANSNTITELVYIPNKYKDGKYFLNLGISNFVLDAAPSRPILFSAD